MRSSLAFIGALVATLIGSTHSANAALSRADITGLYAEVYGMYTTTDPTCQSGLIATIPLQSTPKPVNMAQSPRIGVGPVAKPVNCIVMVMKNEVTVEWLPGIYTGSDSVCDTGGTNTVQICNSGVVPTWPTAITADMAALGLTPAASCPTATASRQFVVPVYLSTFSACTGNVTTDASVSGCVAAGFPAGNTFAAPATAASTNGIKIVAPPTSSNYKFVIDPDQSVGAQGGVCTSLSPPKFGFAVLTSSGS